MHAALSALLQLWPLLLLVAVLSALSNVVRTKGRRKRQRKAASEPGPLSFGSTRPPTYRPKTLVTATERAFYALLVKALPEYTVFTQVAMSALIAPDNYSDGHDYYSLRGRFAQKYVDFVLCHPLTLEVVAVIELDDPSHDADPAADKERDEMLGSAGYRVLRWDVRKKPSTEEIASTVAIALRATPPSR